MRAQRTRRGAVRGALLSAVLVLGVVSMHQLMGGDHRSGHPAGPTPPAAHQMATAHAAPAPQAAAAGLAEQHSAAASTSASAAAAGWAQVAGQSWGPAGTTGIEAGVCVAVLLGGVVLLLLTAGCIPYARAGGADRRRPVTLPLGRGPPRLLLARLCVLRI